MASVAPRAIDISAKRRSPMSKELKAKKIAKATSSAEYPALLKQEGPTKSESTCQRPGTRCAEIGFTMARFLEGQRWRTDQEFQELVFMRRSLDSSTRCHRKSYIGPRLCLVIWQIGGRTPKAGDLHNSKLPYLIATEERKCLNK